MRLEKSFVMGFSGLLLPVVVLLSGCLDSNTVFLGRSSKRVPEKNALGADAPNVDVGSEFLALLASTDRTQFLPQEGGTNALRVYKREGARSYWLAVADPRRVLLEVRLPPGKTRLARTTQTGSDCAVAVNAGYFGATGSASLVVSGGQILSRDSQGLKRKRGIAYPSRAVFASESKGVVSLVWAKMGTLYPQQFASPPNPFTPEIQGKDWQPELAVGGGPMLVWNGAVRVTTDEEAIDASVRPDAAAPRTALAITNSGKLLLYVADGSSEFSGGLPLNELAQELVSLGARSAMNFDGGGSSTFVMNGIVKNRPTDGSERSVASVLCLKP
jgi:hypothetical protein